MISGARYHLVATYSVMKPVSVPLGSGRLYRAGEPKVAYFEITVGVEQKI